MRSGVGHAAQSVARFHLLSFRALLAQLTELARRAVFLHLCGRDAVFGIVVHLLEAAAIGLVDGELHAARNLFWRT